MPFQLVDAILPPTTRNAAKSRRSGFHDPQRFTRLPAAAGEVGNVDRTAAACDRSFRAFTDRAERRRVVDIHVQRQTVPQAVNQAIVFEKIHSAVPAGGLLDRFGPPERMLELPGVLVDLLPTVSGAFALDVQAVGIALEQPARLPAAEWASPTVSCYTALRCNTSRGAQRYRRLGRLSCRHQYGHPCVQPPWFQWLPGCRVKPGMTVCC